MYRKNNKKMMKCCGYYQHRRKPQKCSSFMMAMLQLHDFIVLLLLLLLFVFIVTQQPGYEVIPKTKISTTMSMMSVNAYTIKPPTTTKIQSSSSISISSCFSKGNIPGQRHLQYQKKNRCCSSSSHRPIHNHNHHHHSGGGGGDGRFFGIGSSRVRIQQNKLHLSMKPTSSTTETIATSEVDILSSSRQQPQQLEQQQLEQAEEIPILVPGGGTILSNNNNNNINNNNQRSDIDQKEKENTVDPIYITPNGIRIPQSFIRTFSNNNHNSSSTMKKAQQPTCCAAATTTTTTMSSTSSSPSTSLLSTPVTKNTANTNHNENPILYDYRGFVIGPSIDSKPNYEQIIGPLGSYVDTIFLTLFRQQLAKYVQYDSKLPYNDYQGIIEITKYMNTRPTLSRQNIHTISEQVLRSLFPNWLFPSFRFLFAKPFPIFSNRLNAYATAIAGTWLMGECTVHDIIQYKHNETITLLQQQRNGDNHHPNDDDDAAGVQVLGQQQGVLVHRCRFLEEASCASICVNSCQIPTQNFFRTAMGINLTMVPNYQTYECQFLFGIDSASNTSNTDGIKKSTIAVTDSAWNTPCLSRCPTAGSLRQKHVTSTTTRINNHNRNDDDDSYDYFMKDKERENIQQQQEEETCNHEQNSKEGIQQQQQQQQQQLVRTETCPIMLIDH